MSTTARRIRKRTLKWDDAKQFIEERRVTLLSAGLDKVPAVYKDIHAVMRAQADLVDPIATFRPRIVKMARAGERPED